MTYFIFFSGKGGVGKTTTTINLGACLAQDGQKVLIVDVDPQGNASSGLGINGNDQRFGVYEALIGTADIAQAIVPTPMEGMKILTSGQRLSGAEVELVGMLARETRLRGIIAPLRDEYDFILIDCPPSLSLLTVNGLTAAQRVLIPMQCEYYALEGLSDLVSTIKRVRANLNPQLEIAGLLRTMYDPRNTLSQHVSQQLEQHFGDKVYRTLVPRNVRLAEAPSYGAPAVVWDKASKGAQAYVALTEEILKGTP